MSQPWDAVDADQLAGSLPIWTYEVARRVTDVDEVCIYARHRHNQAPTETHGHLTFRRIPTAVDPLAHKLLRRVPVLWKTRWPLFASSLYYRGYINQVTASLRAHPCDVVHIHNFAQFAPMIRRALPNAKIIVHMHCEWLSQLDATRIAVNLKPADAVFACSQYVVNQIISKHPHLESISHCVYNGVNTEVFAPRETASTTEGAGTKRISFVGRLSPEKGLHVLVDAFNEVVQQEPDARLALIGPEGSAPREFIVDLSEDERIRKLLRFYDRPYTQQLRERLSSQATTRTEFVGGLPQSQLVERYRGADLLVNPSLSEAFGMSLVEAMACGTCVVGARAGGMTEIIDHGKTGLLVAPDDPSALAQAILQGLKDSTARDAMGAAGRSRVLDAFTWDRIAADVTKRYHEL